MADIQTQEMYSRLKGLPKADLIPALKEAIQGRPQKEREEIAENVAAAANGGLPPPNPETRDKLWKIVVTAFAIVLVGGFITLAIGVFAPIQEKGVKPELILTTFTTVVGFLAGLFTPSPVAQPTHSNEE